MLASVLLSACLPRPDSAPGRLVSASNSAANPRPFASVGPTVAPADNPGATRPSTAAPAPSPGIPRAYGEGANTPPPDEGDTGPALRELATRTGKLIGAAVNHAVLPHKRAYREILAREFNYVTPENAMKWGPTQPRRDQFTFADGDAIVAFARAHDMKVKGHALVWHEQLPTWVKTLDAGALRAEMERHIRTVVGHYKGQLLAWDVVNEALTDSGGMRPTVFLEKLGPGYIADAFRWAHDTDPGALLFYNDYNTEGRGPKSDAVFALVERLKKEGVPISGVGLQMHITAQGTAASDVAWNMSRLAELNLLVNISEMDVRVRDVPGTRDDKLAIQRRTTHDIVAACVAQSHCHAVTFWGFSDAYTWVDGFFGADDPLLFSDDMHRKPMYFGVQAALTGR